MTRSMSENDLKAMSNPVRFGGKKITDVGYQTQLCHQQLSYKFHIALKLDNEKRRASDNEGWLVLVFAIFPVLDIEKRLHSNNNSGN